jgi:hypothetical protein
MSPSAERKRAIAMVVGVCALAGAVVAAFAMMATWDGDENWAVIGLLWFLIVFVPLALVGAGIIALSYYLDARRPVRRPAPRIKVR